ncbi:ABC transporter ATP-binding protein [Nocardioides sp. C4-1]|uniref:ABC transporter ATP-binding protein n=1 Tax=Nocardioides sp. C4-1 TaxID=3151851 RepID=UPI00326718AD
MSAALAVRGLSCAVGGRTVLVDVDLEVARGEMVALVGVNGSGKSTLLRTVAGLLTPVHGSVAVGADDVHTLGARARARLMAFVAQEEHPPADMRVVEYVALGRLPYRTPWARGHDDRGAALRALAWVGLDDAADRACADLSGGERRRVSLARGLAQDCDLVVLDEPTNHLDVRHQLDLLALLRASGRTVVTAIHDLALAAAHFDRVVVLHDGVVHASGTPSAALAPDVIDHVFGVPAAYLIDEHHRTRHLTLGTGRPVATKEHR